MKAKIRYNQFHKAFKNGLFGYTDTTYKFAKVRFLRHCRFDSKGGAYYEF